MSSGVYAIDQSVFDLGIVLVAGVVGYGLRRFGVPVLPVVLGVVLGFLVESNYRRSLLLSNGDYMIFLRDPVALALRPKPEMSANLVPQMITATIRSVVDASDNVGLCISLVKYDRYARARIARMPPQAVNTVHRDDKRGGRGEAQHLNRPFAATFRHVMW